MEHLPQYIYPITPTIPYQPTYRYHPYPQISPPQTDCCVALDLSKKRAQSPYYPYNYPSPKPSPTYISVIPPNNYYQPSSKPTLSSPTFTAETPFMGGQPSPKPSPTYNVSVPPSVGTQPSPKPSPTSSMGKTAQSPRSEVSETSCCSSSDVTSSPRSRIRGTRPFKAFPKDPLVLSLSAVSSGGAEATGIVLQDSLARTEESEITKFLIGDSIKAYSEFRQKMMERIAHDNGTNSNMRRTQHQSDKIQDPEYLEKRKRNNEAAKKSRDARRHKQDEIAIRVTFLEQENMMLRYRIETEKEDLERLQKSKRL